jgi:hypothetical protein
LLVMTGPLKPRKRRDTLRARSRAKVFTVEAKPKLMRHRPQVNCKFR